ncbi:MAG: PQQ-binding-like beta-propeller repeat protein, partial [Acidimicrobiia bacterium]|nr:PQQ-binding-like beta-propeller repeat protein [Acidimicrobiia bacterium]
MLRRTAVPLLAIVAVMAALAPLTAQSPAAVAAAPNASTSTPPPTLGTFFPLPPTRILDTRANNAPVGPNSSIDVQAAGAGNGNVPSTGVRAVVVNITATQPTAGSYLTVYPTGTAPPLASNLNFGPGQTIPNLVDVGLGTAGKFSIYNAQGFTHVIADVVGWYSDGSTAAGGRYTALNPSRILDTRTNNTPVGPNSSIDVEATGAGNVPSSGVTAVVVNITAVDPTAVSYLTAYPTGTAPPLASNLNFGPGQIIPNLVVVELGTGGKFSIYNAQGFTHVVVDVVGWYSDSSSMSGGRYTALNPSRILDTRTNNTPVGPNSSIDVQATGAGGVPTAGATGTTGVTAVIVNITATEPTAGSYLTVYPTGTAPPFASNLNFGPGQTIPNLVVVALGTGGKFSIYNAQGNTHVIADVVGYIHDDGPVGQSTAYQLDSAHTGGQLDADLPGAPAQRWARDLGGAVSYPLVAAGRIFVTVSNPSASGGKLYALSEQTGATLWGPIDLGGANSFSGLTFDAGTVYTL